MNRLKSILTILLVCISLTMYGQKEITLTELSRTIDYTEEGKACFEIISDEEGLLPRSMMEDFEKTQLSDGTYSYKAILSLEDYTKRIFYITAPLAIDKEYELRGLKSREYIKVKVTIPKGGLVVTQKDGLVPSKSSDAIYQFLSNIADLDIATNSGLAFKNTGKNDASFYVYELSVPVASTPALKVTIKALGYEDISYNLDEISQRVFGFFIFPAEECFNRNIGLANAYFKDGLYSYAVDYYAQASQCKDVNPNMSFANNKESAEKCLKIRNLIEEYDKSAKRLGDSYAISQTMDSTYWYKNTAIGMMRALLKLNPADNFCSQAEIQKRENDLLNSSRTLVGEVVDSEFENQVIFNAYIYGSEDPKADRKKMSLLGQTDSKGQFVISVPNRYKILLIEHIHDEYKPARISITDGKRYSHKVRLRRKGKNATAL